MTIALRAVTVDPTFSIALGTPVDVRNRFMGTWCRGFEVAGVVDDGYLIRRLSDLSVLPEPLGFDQVRPG